MGRVDELGILLERPVGISRSSQQWLYRPTASARRVAWSISGGSGGAECGSSDMVSPSLAAIVTTAGPAVKGDRDPGSHP